jgi:hypothetical protein
VSFFLQSHGQTPFLVKGTYLGISMECVSHRRGVRFAAPIFDATLRIL